VKTTAVDVDIPTLESENLQRDQCTCHVIASRQWMKRRNRDRENAQLWFRVLNPKSRSACLNPSQCIYSTLYLLFLLSICCLTGSAQLSSPRFLHYQRKLEGQSSSAMHFSLTCPTAAVFLLASTPFCTAFVRRYDSPVISLSIAAKTTPIEADKPAIFYPKLDKDTPFLIGNDGSATGGFKIFNLPTETSGASLNQLAEYATGRTKLVTIIYDVSGKDFIATIGMPDSIFRFFEIKHDGKLKNGKPDLGKAIEARTVLGDWSAICTWRSGVTGRQYLYLFGKGKVVMFVVRAGQKEKLEVVEVRQPA